MVVTLVSYLSVCSIMAWAKKKEIVTDNKDSPDEGNQGQQKSQKEKCHGFLRNQTQTLTLTGACVPVVPWRTLLRAHTILENVAIHALQAVCMKRPTAGIATPITL